MATDDGVQLQPDTAEVLQEEAPPLGTVPVDVRGPVRVHQLPNEPGATRTITIPAFGAGNPKRVVSADHFRGVVELVSHDQDFLWAYTENDATDPSTMYRQPKNVPKRITAKSDVWVLSQTATTTLSIATERWATSG